MNNSLRKQVQNSLNVIRNHIDAMHEVILNLRINKHRDLTLIHNLELKLIDRRKILLSASILAEKEILTDEDVEKMKHFEYQALRFD